MGETVTIATPGGSLLLAADRFQSSNTRLQLDRKVWNGMKHPLHLKMP